MRSASSSTRHETLSRRPAHTRVVNACVVPVRQAASTCPEAVGRRSDNRGLRRSRQRAMAGQRQPCRRSRLDSARFLCTLRQRQSPAPGGLPPTGPPPGCRPASAPGPGATAAGRWEAGRHPPALHGTAPAARVRTPLPASSSPGVPWSVAMPASRAPAWCGHVAKSFSKSPRHCLRSARVAPASCCPHAIVALNSGTPVRPGTRPR